MLDQAVPNWVNWLGFVLTLSGFFVSVIGLRLTYVQASEARSAAQQASRKSQEALDVVRSRTRLAALSSAVSQLDAIRIFVENNEMNASRYAFSSFQRVVQEAIAMFPPNDDDVHNQKIQSANRNLARAARIIDSKIDDKNKVLFSKHIRSISEFLIEEESKAKSELK